MLLDNSLLEEFYQHEKKLAYRFVVIARKIEQHDLDTYAKHNLFFGDIPQAVEGKPSAVSVNLTKQQIEQGGPKLGDYVVHHFHEPHLQWLVREEDWSLQYKTLKPANAKSPEMIQQALHKEQDLFVTTYTRLDWWDRLKLLFLGGLKVKVKIIIPDCPIIKHFNAVTTPAIVRETAYFERKSHPDFGYVAKEIKNIENEEF